MERKRIALFVALAAALPLQLHAADAGTLTTLHDFKTVKQLYAGLLDVGGLLYGVDAAGGAHHAGIVFVTNSVRGTTRVLYSFTGGLDGAQPTGTLIAVDGMLYGTAIGGGAGGNGVVFKLDPRTGTESVLYSFNSGTDAQVPFAGLTYHQGQLYGTSAAGGSAGLGTVYSIDLATGEETVLHSFVKGSTDGEMPYGGVTYVAGNLYGTTYNGGSTGWGTLYKINLSSGQESIVHNFGDLTDGLFPYSSPIFANGALYGVTFGSRMGAYAGTVYKVDPGTGAETILHNFTGTQDGGMPQWQSLTYSNGMLYGATSIGGQYNYGTLFQLDTSTNTETVLYSFTGNADEGIPNGSPVIDNGNL